ncbi:hypothetical protein EIB71_00005 [Kaistella daneshvariae]|uniref:Uncharacterized protein n=1 Tax=Kaistella daneshvariae TaxID=2487074 RepID=A0ABN5SVF7_9FLAO|nr:hypothetical protein [Kaistella daneshvariae]AZI66158.1 hypothetical protein EIB71_00005 [Kaistella daneshvariae]
MQKILARNQTSGILNWKKMSISGGIFFHEDFKTKKTFGRLKLAKIRIENFAELAQSSWNLK